MALKSTVFFAPPCIYSVSRWTTNFFSKIKFLPKNSNFQKKTLQIGWNLVSGGFSTRGIRIWKNFLILVTDRYSTISRKCFKNVIFPESGPGKHFHASAMHAIDSPTRKTLVRSNISSKIDCYSQISTFYQGEHAPNFYLLGCAGTPCIF